MLRMVSATRNIVRFSIPEYIRKIQEMLKARVDCTRSFQAQWKEKRPWIALVFRIASATSCKSETKSTHCNYQQQQAYHTDRFGMRLITAVTEVIPFGRAKHDFFCNSLNTNTIIFHFIPINVSYDATWCMSHELVISDCVFFGLSTRAVIPTHPIPLPSSNPLLCGVERVWEAQ